MSSAAAAPSCVRLARVEMALVLLPCVAFR
jgi:hypothetical protein